MKAHVLLQSSLAAILLIGCGTPVPAHEASHGSAHPAAVGTPDVKVYEPGVAVAADERGTLWLARVRDGHLLVSRSRDNGASFTGETTVNPVAEVIRSEGQSRPRIAARAGIIAVAWSQSLPKRFAGHVRFSRSVDGGKTFSAPTTINENRDEIGHGFAALAMSDRGALAITWLDGRHRAQADAASKRYAGSSIYYALSADGGASFSPNRKLADHTCECCRIGTAYGDDGIPVALWRHLFDGGARDFALAPLTEGSTLLRASEDHWQIDGCPHHGGDLAIDGDGGRHLVWYTGSAENPGLFYRRINGTKRGKPMAFGDRDAQAGYPTVFARGRIAAIAWREFDGARYRVLAMRSADRGERWSAPRVLAQSTGTADLPLFVAGASSPLLAWNTTSDGLLLLNAGAAP